LENIIFQERLKINLKIYHTMEMKITLKHVWKKIWNFLICLKINDA